jgi:ATP-dependent helicase/nuclease subunit A
MLEKNRQISSQAIETLNKNILVSASAGAGKTKLLIDRLIKRIMIDHIEVSNILALTFTEAAASEMKHRLQKEITTQLSIKEDTFLRRQLLLVETSSISTIHSFCLSVVKDYGYVLNLDPKMTKNLLDDATRSLLVEQCLNSVINDAIKNKDEAFVVLVQTLCPRSENLEPLKKAIMNVVHVRNAQVAPIIWDRKILELYNKVDSFKQLPKSVLTLLQEDYIIQVNQLRTIVAEIIDDYRFILEDNITTWEEIATLLSSVPSKIEASEFNEANSNIRLLGPKKTKSISDSEEYTALRAKYNAKLKKLIQDQFLEQELLSDLALQQPLVEWLLILAKNMMDAYKLKKQEKIVMDFDDMEKFALAILSDSKFNIDKVYQRIFSDVLVDEFQDTNDIQHAIITKVSREDNIFLVGDIKQSIYRFRNAKPQLMRDLIQDETKDHLVFNLPNNFRSSETIVAFNNFVFSHLMNIHTFDDEYQDNDHVLIGLESQKENPVPVELDVIDSDTLDDVFFDNEEEMLEFEETTQEGKLKARHIAQRISLFKEMGYDFKDMCVLVRTHRIKAFLKDVFDEINIPYFIDSKSGFFQSQAVQDVLGYLRVLSDPNDLISLTGLLSSGFFQVSFNELAEASILRKKNNITLLSAYRICFSQYIQELEQTRFSIKDSKLSDVIIQVYQKNDFYALHCAEQSKINLDYLLEKALLYEQKGEHGITRFLATVKNLQDEVSSEAIPIGSEDDVVKVMTIHQSKGLQFPIVFFWTSNINKNMDVADNLIVDASLGIGMHTLELPYRFRKRNLLRSAIEFNSIKQELQEQIRLLYVALTRAESRMILVATKSKENLNSAIDQYLIYHQKGNAHWLTSIFKQFERDFMSINHYKPVNMLPFYPAPSASTQTISIKAKKEVVEEKQKVFSYIPTLNFEQTLKANERGSIIHDALSTLIMNNWELYSMDTINNLTSNQRSQIEQFIHHPFSLSIKNYPMESEYPLFMHYQNRYQQGYIDLLVEASDKNIIIDFKSDVVTTKEELVTRHKDQLLGYVYALQQVYPNKPIEAYVYSLHLNSYVSIQ